MAILDILEYPDPRLRTVAEPVPEVTDATRQLIDDMFETMYAAPGIGLAATQVDVHQQIIVMDLSENRDEPHVFINPSLATSGDPVENEEGCLSIPGYYDRVKRPERAAVMAIDRDGEAFTVDAEGLLAVCIQHEVDHLNGKLFIDYLSALKRGRVRKHMAKHARQRDSA